MAKITGRGEVFINGIKMGNTESPTVKFGGEIRETVMGPYEILGHKVTGIAAGGVDLTIAHISGLSSDDFDVVDANVIVIMDSGVSFIITQATRVGDPPELDGAAGTITVSLEGKKTRQV